MLETTATVGTILADAATGAAAILGNGSAVYVGVGIVAAVGGVYMLARFLFKAGRQIR